MLGGWNVGNLKMTHAKLLVAALLHAALAVSVDDWRRRLGYKARWIGFLCDSVIVAEKWVKLSTAKKSVDP